MTARTVETATESGGDGGNLHGSPMNATAQGILDAIMAWQLPDTPSAEQRKCLKKMLADLAIGDRLVEMADDGRRPRAICEIPA